MCKSNSHFFSGTSGHRQSRGTLKGSLNDLTIDEKNLISELLEEKKNIEIIPRSRKPDTKTPDIKVDGIRVEIKHLHSSNTNTGSKRIREGFGQNAQKVLIDGRLGKLTRKDADTIISRARGAFPDQKLPGPVEIRTVDGNFIYE
ncbi:MAG: hypothetical protein J6J31_12100 [Thermoguttaceae bacterium]|nr:hypothetical protein [Thermoguttaceae bacterium]